MGDISEEEAVALQAAGRDVPTATGRFSGDCAVAMGGTSIETTRGTVLYHTAGQSALPMAQRLAAKLHIPQLTLALDLPPSWISNGAVAPEDACALQALELGVRQ